MSNSKLSKAAELFLTFLKIGAFTFGGGYAMIPVIQKEVVEKKSWITDSDILDIIAIAESTPGPIAINSATFIGNKVAGVLGSFAATVGVVLPSFLIISIISLILEEFKNVTAVKYAFCGIRAGVLALITKALISMYRQCPHNLISYIIAIIAFISAAILKVNVLLVIIGCAVIGLSYSLIAGKKSGGEKS